jgi:glycosyltransferase involved in cell wall biosynthesis
MACGTPVVAARAGALPDTCGDAALVVPPDADSLADAIERVLTTPEAFRRLGLRRARAFTWDATARKVDALLTSRSAPPAA